MPSVTGRAWWKEAIVYQIYPYSFKDTTGTGIGDLNGIASKLQYLRDLGVDVIWLSPIYASPMKDMGYDISDYRAINPAIGTMRDWEILVEEAHKLDMRIVMDLVVNHTSDQHEWFQESKDRGVSGKKRDWYVWKPARDGKEPNNWGSIFGGSAWQYDEKSNEYYLHVFDVSQPDLNWENPEVREAVWDIMRFWLQKGCDGFRMDVINCISKVWSDAPIVDTENKFQYGLLHRFNGPKVVDYLREMNEQVLDHYPNVFTVGETPGVATPEDAIKYVQGGKPLQMIFNFEHMYMDIEEGKRAFYHRDWKLTDLKDILGTWMEYMQENDGWDSLYLENHDQPRILGRWADDRTYRSESAKMLAIFHATGRGTLYLYQGQEMGMTNTTWTYEELRDVDEINFYNFEKAKRGEGADMSDVLKQIQVIGRDNARTPVQWDDSNSAGFTTGEPWIKVNEDYKQWNIQKQQQDPASVLSFWKTLLKIRKEHTGLVYGIFKMLDRKHEEVYAYTRTDDVNEYLVVCSFSKKEVAWECLIEKGNLLISNYPVEEDGGQKINLRAYEARVYSHKL